MSEFKAEAVAAAIVLAMGVLVVVAMLGGVLLLFKAVFE